MCLCSRVFVPKSAGPPQGPSESPHPLFPFGPEVPVPRVRVLELGSLCAWLSHSVHFWCPFQSSPDLCLSSCEPSKDQCFSPNVGSQFLSFHPCVYYCPAASLHFPFPPGTALLFPGALTRPLLRSRLARVLPLLPRVPAPPSRPLSQPPLRTGSLPSPHPQPIKGLTTTVLVAEVGEAPHVGEVHREAYHRQQEVDLLAPGLPGLLVASAGRQETLDAVALFHHQQLRGFAPLHGLLGPRVRPAALRLHLRLHPRQKHECGWRGERQRHWEHAEALRGWKEKMRSLGHPALLAPPETSRERGDTAASAHWEDAGFSKTGARLLGKKLKQ